MQDFFCYLSLFNGVKSCAFSSSSRSQASKEYLNFSTEKAAALLARLLLFGFITHMSLEHELEVCMYPP